MVAGTLGLSAPKVIPAQYMGTSLQPFPPKVQKAAVEFEQMMLGQMLAPMWDGIATDGLTGGGPGEQAFRSMLLDSYAKEMTQRGGLGLAVPVARAMMTMQEA
ncbi:rod-binding protein [Zavarzinia sp. CC-PAN008]|uniref:rod-binding protein n=1 Tax=Zavarzinia sp. CC-PAN008 TaxID=3243332 RepID=UPI003F742D65